MDMSIPLYFANVVDIKQDLNSKSVGEIINLLCGFMVSKLMVCNHSIHHYHYNFSIKLSKN